MILCNYKNLVWWGIIKSPLLKLIKVYASPKAKTVYPALKLIHNLQEKAKNRLQAAHNLVVLVLVV
jgi:hypothetical protein